MVRFCHAHPEEGRHSNSRVGFLPFFGKNFRRAGFESAEPFGSGDKFNIEEFGKRLEDGGEWDRVAVDDVADRNFRAYEVDKCRCSKRRGDPGCPLIKVVFREQRTSILGMGSCTYSILYWKTTKVLARLYHDREPLIRLPVSVYATADLSYTGYGSTQS